MSLIKKELTEKSGFVMEFSVSKEAYAKAENEAYKKNVKSINVPGFRKGKAPKAIIEKYYGKGIWFEDAINACIPEAFEAAITEAGYDIVGNPKFDLVSMDGDIVLKAVGFVKPEVTIENYKGIEVKKKAVRITKNMISAEIDKVRDRNARFIQESDEAIKDGDTITLDFEGFVDGVAFDGGKAEGHDLKLGSGSFIPGFEDQIAVVKQTLRDIGAGDKPTFLIFNKIDAYSYIPKEEDDLTPVTKENLSLDDLKKSWIAKANTPCIFISAVEKMNMPGPIILHEVAFWLARQNLEASI